MFLFRDWSNSLCCIETSESFESIALHTDKLQRLLQNLEINVKNVKLTSDQQYVADVMGALLLFLPLYLKKYIYHFLFTKKFKA